MKKIKKTTEQFIIEAKQIHGDEYIYDLVEYQTSNKNVKIVCKQHGIFEQEANSHLRGRNCPKCGENTRIQKRQHSITNLIDLVNKKHNFKYTYSIEKYVNNKEKIKITCPIHGKFEQRIDCHLQGQGCPRCGGTGKVSLDEFINTSNEKHENFYDYSKVEFNLYDEKITIICPKHGEFLQSARAHSNGQGCSKCKTSRLEKRILKLLKQIENLNIIQYYKTEWLGRQHIDIYLPDYKIGIECHGIQHYEPIEKFGGEEGFLKTIERDSRKRKLCIENDITLFEIPFYYKPTEIEEIIKKIRKL